MIRSAGRILTTAGDLGASPLADFTIGDATGQAWVIGRDDDFDLAVLDVIDPQGPYPFVTLKSAPGHPLVNETFTLLQFSSFGAALLSLPTSVLALRIDGNGIQYIQLQGVLEQEGSQGGALVDSQGVVRGLRISRAQMQEALRECVRRSGPWSLRSLANQLIPRLEAGISILDKVEPTCDGLGLPPLRPAIFRGDITSGGVDAALRAATVYARVRGGGAEEWYLTTVGDTSRYYVSIGTCTAALQSNATVEFWYDRMVAPQTAAFQLQTNLVVDLVFP